MMSQDKLVPIRVVRSTTIQDGVERLRVAGESALQFAREQDELLREHLSDICCFNG